MYFDVGMEYSRGSIHGKMEFLEPTAPSNQKGIGPMLSRPRTKQAAFSTSPQLGSKGPLVGSAQFASTTAMSSLCPFQSPKLSLMFLLVTGIATPTRYNITQHCSLDGPPSWIGPKPCSHGAIQSKSEIWVGLVRVKSILDLRTHMDFWDGFGPQATKSNLGTHPSRIILLYIYLISSQYMQCTGYEVCTHFPNIVPFRKKTKPRNLGAATRLK